MAPKPAHSVREAPGVHVTASAKVKDGLPASDDGFVGIAVKQIPKSSDVARSTLDDIEISEKYYLLITGEADVINGSAQGGPGLTLAKGTAVYINDATNALVLAATALTAGVLNAGFSKYGKVAYLAPERGLPTGWVTINLDQAARIPG
jgi:hypothetical protein